MEYLLSHGTITLVFLLMGVVLYFVINYLFDSIGKGGIDRVFETEEDKHSREFTKKKAGKIYAILLFGLVIVINIMFYFIR